MGINIFGLAFMVAIMAPNIVFMARHGDAFESKYKNKAAECTEQVGRYGCFAFMIFNIPKTCFGWWSDEAFAVYLIVDTLLVLFYIAVWIICRRKNSIFKALVLSATPSAIFLFSGVMSRSVLLVLSALLFAPTHILISYKNAK